MKKTQEYYSSNAPLLCGTEVELSPHSELQLLCGGMGLAEHILVRTRCQLPRGPQPAYSCATPVSQPSPNFPIPSLQGQRAGKVPGFWKQKGWY